MTTAISELTGQEIDTASPEWREECEIRHVLSMPNRDVRNDYLRLVAKHRGQPASDDLQRKAEKLFYTRRVASK